MRCLFRDPYRENQSKGFYCSHGLLTKSGCIRSVSMVLYFSINPDLLVPVQPGEFSSEQTIPKIKKRSEVNRLAYQVIPLILVAFGFSYTQQEKKYFKPLCSISERVTHPSFARKEEFSLRSATTALGKVCY